MMLEVYRATWYAETGLCDFGGRGYWHGTTSSAPCDSEEQARGVLLSLGGISEDPKKPGYFHNSFPMGLARIRKELVLDEAETAKLAPIKCDYQACFCTITCHEV